MIVMRRKGMKRLVSAVSMVLMLVVAVAAQAPTEISFLSNSVSPYDVAIPAMIKAFEAQNPGIKVKLEQVPTKNLWELVEIKMAVKESTPDAFFVDIPLLPAYVVKNYLEPLDGYITAADKKQWVDVAVKASTVDGKLYAVPFQNSSAVLYYNKDILTEAGVPFPSKDPSKRLTWEELVEYAKKCTLDRNKDGVTEVFGLGMAQVSRPYAMLPIPLSKGGKAISADGRSVSGLLTTKEWTDAGKFIYDLYNTWKISPKGVDANTINSYFPSGNLAFFVGPDYSMYSYAKNQKLNWDYAPYPYFKGGEPVTPTGSWHLGINKYSKHKDAAMKFIKFMTTPPACIDWFNLDGHLPTARATLDYISTNKKFGAWPYDMFNLLLYESQHTAVPRPSTPGYLEYEEILTAAFEDIRNGKDPASVFSEAESRIERTLRKYR
jgi:multiple sugar transport system substrate-binding protein